jgi:murein DD-endopeptidase MepM/ murein hydrolase activator NlpD
MKQRGLVIAAAAAAMVLVPTAAASPRLALGAHGSAVRVLELDLAWHGFPSGRIDGRFGPEVASALRHFQRSVDLQPDGTAGPATLAALRRPAPRAAIPLGWPLLAPVGDQFGVRGSRFHSGIDLLARAGTEVIASAPGTVTWAAPRAGGWGKLVVVRHMAAVRTLYAHLESIAVHVGEWVAGGTVLGRVGATGDATGPHLHFEVRVRGAAVNPLHALVSLDG